MAKQTTALKESAEDTVDPNSATVTLEFRGEHFTVPKRRGRWPLEAIMQFGRGQGLQAIRALLSDDDWTRLKRVCPTGDDFDQFLGGAIDVLTNECVL